MLLSCDEKCYVRTREWREWTWFDALGLFDTIMTKVKIKCASIEAEIGIQRSAVWPRINISTTY